MSVVRLNMHDDLRMSADASSTGSSKLDPNVLVCALLLWWLVGEESNSRWACKTEHTVNKVSPLQGQLLEETKEEKLSFGIGGSPLEHFVLKKSVIKKMIVKMCLAVRAERTRRRMSTRSSRSVWQVLENLNPGGLNQSNQYC